MDLPFPGGEDTLQAGPRPGPLQNERSAHTSEIECWNLCSRAHILFFHIS